MRVLLMNADMVGRWLDMRLALWSDTPAGIHRGEIDACLAAGERQAAFLCEDDAGVAAGFAEVSLRTDCVNGCETSPVAFLEGIYVLPPLPALWRGAGADHRGGALGRQPRLP